RFAALDLMMVVRELTVAATVGSPEPALEGSTTFKNRVEPADHVTGIDVVVHKSFASRQAEWKAHRGTASAGGSMVAVLDGADLAAEALAVDPVTSDIWVLTTSGTIYGDALVVIDAAGKQTQRWKIKGHALAYSRPDDCFWSSANVFRR